MTSFWINQSVSFVQAVLSPSAEDDKGYGRWCSARRKQQESGTASRNTCSTICRCCTSQATTSSTWGYCRWCWRTRERHWYVFGEPAAMKISSCIDRNSRTVMNWKTELRLKAMRNLAELELAPATWVSGSRSLFVSLRWKWILKLFAIRLIKISKLDNELELIMKSTHCGLIERAIVEHPSLRNYLFDNKDISEWLGMNFWTICCSNCGRFQVTDACSCDSVEIIPKIEYIYLLNSESQVWRFLDNHSLVILPVLGTFPSICGILCYQQALVEMRFHLIVCDSAYATSAQPLCHSLDCTEYIGMVFDCRAFSGGF